MQSRKTTVRGRYFLNLTLFYQESARRSLVEFLMWTAMGIDDFIVNNSLDYTTTNLRTRIERLRGDGW